MTTDPQLIAAVRYGYGLPLPAGAPVEAGAMIAALQGPDHAAARYPAAGMAEVVPLWARIEAARIAAKERPEDRQAQKAARRAVQEGLALQLAGAQAALARALDSPDGLRERLSAFWCNHFTVTSRGRNQHALPTALMTDAVRPHLAGRFADLLTACVTHPAMLLYLDQANAIGPNSRRGRRSGRGLNENLAREVLELHTMGAGAGYRQTDVRELAELFTGLTVTIDRGFGFDAARAEEGAETVLGRTYGAEGMEPVRAVLADLALRPETARHLCTKLAAHFLADPPDPGAVAAMVAEWERTGGEIAAVMAALLAHPAAWAPPGAKARAPFDWLAACLRALGLSGAEVAAMRPDVFRRQILEPMGAMGQPWQGAAGPDGFADRAEDWITPLRLAARIAWAMEAPGRLVAAMPAPEALAARAFAGAPPPRLIWAATRAESRREGVGIVLAAPDFVRR
jgi:uncharacterized protein (DUF1800 family)